MNNIISAVIFLFNVYFFGESTKFEPESDQLKTINGRIFDIIYNNQEYPDYKSRQSSRTEGNQSIDFAWTNDIERTITVFIEKYTTIGFMEIITDSVQLDTTTSLRENATASLEDDSREVFFKLRENITASLQDNGTAVFEEESTESFLMKERENTTISLQGNGTAVFEKDSTEALLMEARENTTAILQDNAADDFVDDLTYAFFMKAREKLRSGKDTVDIWGDSYSKFQLSGIKSDGLSGTIDCPDDPAIILKWQKWLTVSIFNSFEENESQQVIAHLISQSGAPWKGVRDQAHWPDNGWRPQSVTLEEFSPGFLKLNIVYHFKNPIDTHWTEYTMFLEFRQYQYNASNVVTFGHSRIAFHNQANIPGDLDWYKYNPKYVKNGLKTLPFKFGERFILASEWFKDGNQPYTGEKGKKKQVITTIMMIGPDEKYEDADKVLELTAGPGKKAKKTWLTYLIRKYYGKRSISRNFELHEEVTKHLGEYKDGHVKSFNKDKISVDWKNASSGKLIFRDTMFKNTTVWNITRNNYVGTLKNGNISIEYPMTDMDRSFSATSAPASTRETTPKYVTVYPSKQRMKTFIEAPGWARVPAVLFLIIPLMAGVCFCFFGIFIPFLKILLERMTAYIHDPRARTY